MHEIVARSGVHELCSVFVHHTSASLILANENADPQVRRDLGPSPRDWCPMAIACSSTSTRATTTCPRTCAPC
ncbi:MAG: YjbQ family protein [Nannocystaceae bacterium]